MDPIPFVRARWQTVAHREAIDLIVIHTMELPCRPGIADRLAHRFNEGERKVSAHYCVDPVAVVQCVRETDVAWHCPCCNRRGIGIEHAGYAFGGADHDPTDWQSDEGQAVLRLSAVLVAGICRRWDIPPARVERSQLAHGGRGIVGHADATAAFGTAGGHRDPGPNFPWSDYLDRVATELARLPPQS